MLVDKNSCDLLRYLLHLEEPETIMVISRSLHQSRRKIYYHLDKINDSMPDDVDKIVSIPRVGILLNQEQKKVCTELLNTVDSYSYVMSMSERIQLMILYICIAADRVTIEKLIELTEVSRNTVLNDLSVVRGQLQAEQYQVTLNSTKSKGYFLKCHPFNKIQYIYALLYDIFSEGSASFLNVLKEKVDGFTKDEILFSADLQVFLGNQVQVLEQDIGKKINHHDIEFMLKVLPYLLLSYRNMEMTVLEREAIKREFALVRKRKEYQVTKLLNANLKNSFPLELDEIEISLVTVLLLSYRKDRDIHATSQDFFDLKRVLDKFIWRFEANSNFEIESKEDLIRNLLTHFKSLLFRKTYRILSKNPLTQQIKEKYPDLFALTKACAVILEEEWMISLTDDELAYLTVHMGGSLKYNQAEKSDVKRIYLVCDEGVAVQKLLLKQCQYHLPNESIKAVFTTEQFKSVEDILEVDLLISTSDNTGSSFPTIQVHPILDYEDVLKITRFVKYQVFNDERSNFGQELEKLLAYYIKDRATTKELNSRIRKLINENLLSTAVVEESETPRTADEQTDYIRIKQN